MTLGTDKLKFKESNADTHMPDGYHQLSGLVPLPKEWGVVRLGEVVSITRKSRSFQPPKKIAFIPMDAIPDDGSFYPSKVVWKSTEGLSSGVYCEGGDILFAKITPSLENGKQCLVPKAIRHAYATTEVYPLKPGEQVDTFFLFQLLRAPWVRKYLAEKMEGSTGRQRLAKQALMNYPIALPPLPEQRAIAHVLRTVQESKEATEKAISALHELKKSLMQHLFTYGLVPPKKAEHSLLKNTQIGRLPKHWQVVRLDDITEKTTQLDPRKTPDGKFKYIDVSSINNRLYRIKHFTVYHGHSAPSRARKHIREKDVIFATVRPYLKRIALVPREVDGEICSTAFCVLRAKRAQIMPEYLFYAVTRDEFIKAVVARQRGSSYPAVTDKDVKQSLIPLPPLPEQRQIAEILQAVDRKIEAEENRKAALEELFKSLLRELMTAKRRLPKEFIAQFADKKPEEVS